MSVNYEGQAINLKVGEEKKMHYEELVNYQLPSNALNGPAKSKRLDIPHMRFSCFSIGHPYYLVKRHNDV